MRSIRSLLEPLPLCCGATDRRGRVLWMNAAAAQLAGTKPAALVGRDIREVWPPAPMPRPIERETRIEHAVVGGRSVWLRVTRMPVGRSVVAVSEDVTAAVERGAMRALTSLACREARANPAPSVATAAIARAFARGASAPELIDRGIMPTDLAVAAVHLLL